MFVDWDGDHDRYVNILRVFIPWFNNFTSSTGAGILCNSQPTDCIFSLLISLSIVQIVKLVKWDYPHSRGIPHIHATASSDYIVLVIFIRYQILRLQKNSEAEFSYNFHTIFVFTIFTAHLY